MPQRIKDPDREQTTSNAKVSQDNLLKSEKYTVEHIINMRRGKALYS